jgi:hypothetical protein
MRHLLVGLGLLGLTAAGCATSTELERKAQQHDMQADAAAGVRDYNRAAQEKATAAKLHAKAVKRAYEEGNSESVVIPSYPGEVPHPPPPQPQPVQ